MTGFLCNQVSFLIAALVIAPNLALADPLAENVTPIIPQVISQLSTRQVAQSPKADDRLTAIFQLVSQGKLDTQTAILYRYLAFKDPSLLPENLAKLPRPTVACATPYFVDIFQAAQLGQLSSYAIKSYKQVDYRPPSYDYLESSLYPFRVHYPAESYWYMAEDILAYAEEAWQKQVTEIGFLPPVGDYGTSLEGSSTDLDIYIGDASGAAGYTAPEQVWNATRRTDCTTHIVIEQELENWDDGLKTTVAHELNHAMQAAYDCIEYTAFWEHTAVYIEKLTYPRSNGYLSFLPHFQAEPHKPFETFERGSGYQYGAVLVTMTLEEAFGANDGSLVLQVWESSIQEDYENEPDFFDGLEGVLNSESAAGLDEFQQNLTIWRYLVGPYADGEHFTDAESWDDYQDLDPVPTHEKIIKYADLPQNIDSRTDVYEHGSSYVRVSLGSKPTGGLTIDFTGEDTTRWAVNTLCGGGAATEVTPMVLNENGTGASEVSFSEASFCTIAISNLGRADYDPDDDFESIAGNPHYYSLVINPGAGGSTCDCDTTTACDPACTCDPECSCNCDDTTACDLNCDCDPECGGCSCAANTKLSVYAAGLGVLGALLAFGRRRRLQHRQHAA